MTRYEQGFLTKCAEHGVDGRKLLKQAKSTPLKEVFYGIPGAMVLPLGGTAHNVGSLAGGVADPSEDDKYSDAGYNFIPGVGPYRLSNRTNITSLKMQELAKKLKKKGVHPRANNIAEWIGSHSAPILMSAVGAGLGALAQRRGVNMPLSDDFGAMKPYAGALYGGALGAAAGGAASVAGSIAALLQRRRTDKEQLEKETAGRAIAKYLIPGLASYDQVMRIGKSRDYVGG